MKIIDEENMGANDNSGSITTTSEPELPVERIVSKNKGTQILVDFLNELEKMTDDEFDEFFHEAKQYDKYIGIGRILYMRHILKYPQPDYKEMKKAEEEWKNC